MTVPQMTEAFGYDALSDAAQSALDNGRRGQMSALLLDCKKVVLNEFPWSFAMRIECVLAFGDGFVDRYTYTGYRECILGSPYKSQHLARLRWLQSADVLYLFHPDVPIHMLRRETGGWRFEKVELDKGPFEDTNTDETKKLYFIEVGDYKYGMYANFPLFFLTWDLLEALIKVEALDEPAANFIRLGWNVEPLDGLLKAYQTSTLCWSVFLDGRIAALFGCAPGAMPGMGSPWLVTAPEIERVKLRFIRQSRPYVREMLERYPILTAYVYRGNKPLIGWMRWMGFELSDVSEMFARGELRAWDCRWL